MNPRRALTLLALLAAIVVGAQGARATERPVPIERKLRELSPGQAELEQRNTRLLRKLRRRERQVRRLHRQVRRLRGAMRERLSVSGGLVSAFLCIHHYEGAWTANTGNGYHGGLQMDSSFMRSYGGSFYRAWGGAENWPPFIQLAVGMNAYLSGRGFGPWPQTSRMCGL